MEGKIIAIALVVLIVGGALAYIIKAKKNGKKCIGCPFSASCSGGCKCYTGSPISENNDENSKSC